MFQLWLNRREVTIILHAYIHTYVHTYTHTYICTYIPTFLGAPREFLACDFLDADWRGTCFE